MDEITHRNLMRLSATSRVATADASDFTRDSAASADRDPPPPLSEMLGMSLDALLGHFRPK